MGKRREKPEQRTKARKRKKGEAYGQPQPIEENGRDDTENGGKPQGRHANGKGKL